jgi:hypothetical protein
MHKVPRLRPVLLLAVLAALALPSAAHAASFTKAFWGPVTIHGKSQFPVYKRLGVRLFEIQVNWSSVAARKPSDPTNPKDPAYRWPSNVATAVKQAKKYRMGVLIMIIGAPRWANGGRPWNYAPNPWAYAHFATAAARHYPSVHHWMVWGEPSRQHNWQPLVPQQIGRRLTQEQLAAPRRYARMLDAAYGALKRQSRGNLVIGGNTFTAGDIRPARWIRGMRLPNGKPPRLDLYGHNPFCLRAPDLRNPPGPQEIADFSDLGRLQKTIDHNLARPRGKKRIRLFLSEWTVPTGPDREFNFYATRATQARFIKAGLGIARRLGVYGLGWIHLRDEAPKKDSRRSQGGLLDWKGKPKAGYYAFKRY